MVASSGREVIASLTSVTKVYRTGSQERVKALDSVDFTLYRGEFVAVVGPSGSGKSTLLHILGCLDKPTSGRVVIDGIDRTDAPQKSLPALRNRTIGFLFQQHHLFPTLTAMENVAVPLRLGGVPRSAALRRAAEWLERVELYHRLHHRPGELSGGEQQRVAIARALVGEPALLLADEPTGELDRETTRSILKLLLHLNATRGQTCVIATHDPHVYESCPRRVTMEDGRILLPIMGHPTS